MKRRVVVIVLAIVCTATLCAAAWHERQEHYVTVKHTYPVRVVATASNGKQHSVTIYVTIEKLERKR